ncbi:hypothetical protein MA16_Dca002458 [Dendrobium catenatum]|uniref:Uncharacterized protein n=1 Tax=Dendrobium catenatum TaxID=906689 RepID=A0A2I0W0L5_9ASPA|nr:hypothetical protein MA16_Dca002458 [Dendrobium catenatum]
MRYLEALNVPLAGTPVVTFWEGELTDAKNYTFYIGELLPFWEGELIDAKK